MNQSGLAVEVNAAKNLCDIKNCKNEASYFIRIKGFSGKMFFCKKCMEKLSSAIQNFTVPKSPGNRIKKSDELKRATFKTENGYEA